MQSGIRLSHLAIAAFVALGAVKASAQDYPERPITFIYPYSAGSSLDAAWRSIAEAASEELGQAIVFENQPGAGGMLGFSNLMRAPSDGYTIGLTLNITTVWQPLIDPANRDFVAGRDYEPIITGLEHLLVLVARKDAPYDDLQGLIDHARANPGAINAGSAGPGTGGHLGLALLEQKADIDIEHIAYNGTAPAITAILGGEIDILFTDVLAKQHVEQGSVIALGVGADDRWSFMPEVPTMSELGLQDFRNASWSGVGAPAGTPAEILDRLNEAFSAALSDQEVAGKLERAGWVIRSGTRREANELITRELEFYAPIIEDAGITLD